MAGIIGFLQDTSFSSCTILHAVSILNILQLKKQTKKGEILFLEL